MLTPVLCCTGVGCVLAANKQHVGGITAKRVPGHHAYQVLSHTCMQPLPNKQAQLLSSPPLNAVAYMCSLVQACTAACTKLLKHTSPHPLAQADPAADPAPGHCKRYRQRILPASTPCRLLALTGSLTSSLLSIVSYAEQLHADEAAHARTPATHKPLKTARQTLMMVLAPPCILAAGDPACLRPPPPQCWPGAGSSQPRAPPPA